MDGQFASFRRRMPHTPICKKLQIQQRNPFKDGSIAVGTIKLVSLGIDWLAPVRGGLLGETLWATHELTATRPAMHLKCSFRQR